MRLEGEMLMEDGDPGESHVGGRGSGWSCAGLRTGLGNVLLLKKFTGCGSVSSYPLERHINILRWNQRSNESHMQLF